MKKKDEMTAKILRIVPLFMLVGYLILLLLQGVHILISDRTFSKDENLRCIHDFIYEYYDVNGIYPVNKEDFEEIDSEAIKEYLKSEKSFRIKTSNDIYSISVCRQHLRIDFDFLSLKVFGCNSQDDIVSIDLNDKGAFVDFIYFDHSQDSMVMEFFYQEIRKIHDEDSTYPRFMGLMTTFELEIRRNGNGGFSYESNKPLGLLEKKSVETFINKIESFFVLHEINGLDIHYSIPTELGSVQ